MTNDITAEEYRTAQRVLASDRTRGDLAGIAVWCGQRAAAIDAAQARDTEAEQLAANVFKPAQKAADPRNAYSWGMTDKPVRLGYVAGVRAVLDHLASRLAPDNGITLTADEAADLLVVTAPRAEYTVAASRHWNAAMDRLRARFAPTEQAEPRTFPLAEDIPDGVVAEGRGGYPRYTGGQIDYPERTRHEGPFVEVVGEAL